MLRSVLACAVVLAVSLPPASVHAQEGGTETLEDLRTALARGDAKEIADRSAMRIDLTVMGTSELLSRSQARYVIHSFFAEYPPVRVEFLDSSESNGNWFASAGYWSEAGPDPLTVYLRLRRGDQGWELRELRFDRASPR